MPNFLTALILSRFPITILPVRCQYVAGQKSKEVAAVAGAGAAAYYGLEILKEGIETNPSNFTRFFIIARSEHPEPAEIDKATVVFSVPDKKGSLVRVLEVMNESGLNMKKLESRPIHGKPWQYMFYSDIELPSKEDFLEKGLNRIKDASEDFRLLGMYKAGI